MRTISPFEFVRRFHHGVTKHDGRYVWFLGAGCSVSSGIGDAAATSMRWLSELKYLETGEEGGVGNWAPDRFPHFNSDDPAALYADVLHALFYTDQEKERELERINAEAEPGFGYATLAQLVTQAAWGERCNTVVTTNFDDLAADALYLYSQQKPQVLTHESFDRRIRISTSRPTILKIYGDAHLGQAADGSNMTMLRSDVKDRLRAQFTESAIVFVGYGGRDMSVLDLLEGLPSGAPAGGIYWVNADAPQEPLLKWLEARNTIWAPYSDFEGLMYLLRREFALGHPRIDRFDQILRRYDAQYKDLAARQDLAKAADAAWSTPVASVAQKPSAAPVDAVAPDSTPAIREDETHEEIARAEMRSDESDDWGLSIGDSYSGDDVIAEQEVEFGATGEPEWTEDTPEEEAGGRSAATPFRSLDGGRSAQDPSPVSGDIRGGGTATYPYTGGSAAPAYADTRPRGRIDVLIAAAVEAMAAEQGSAEPAAPEHANTDNEDSRPPLELVTRIDDDEERDAPVSAIADRETSEERDEGAAEAADLAPKAALEEDGADAELLDSLASDADGIGEDEIAALLAAEESAEEAVGEPTVPPLTTIRTPVEEHGLLAPRRLLARGEAAALDRRFMAALQDAPNNARLLSQYAQFLVTGRRDYDGAEHYFNRAFDADPLDSSILWEFAKFLATVRRDFDRAEDCYRLALRADFENADILADYAKFLWKCRGDYDAAGECFQVAVDSAPRNARVLAAYAKYLAEVEGNPDAAYALLKLASASTHDDPVPVIELAEFSAASRGDREKAEAAYKRAMAIAPESAETLAAAASFIAEDPKRCDEAAKLFKRAVELDPLSPSVLRRHAAFQFRFLEDIDSADETLRRAIDADPGDARTALAYARFQETERKDLNIADEYYRRAVHLNPRDADTLAAHARFLYEARNNPAGAEDRFRKALKLEPANPQILADLGNFLLTERKNLDAAEPLLRKAVELAPRNAAALADLGKLLRERGDTDGAEEAFRKAIAVDPRRAATLRRYARFVNTARSNPGAAEEFYRRALNDNPDDEAPRKRDPDLLLELWFYRYAFDERAASDSIKAAIWLVQSGGRTSRQDLDAVLEFAIADGHGDPALLRKLAAVACGEADVSELREFEVA